jgi:hypothetical protein
MEYTDHIRSAMIPVERIHADPETAKVLDDDAVSSWFGDGYAAIGYPTVSYSFKHHFAFIQLVS